MQRLTESRLSATDVRCAFLLPVTFIGSVTACSSGNSPAPDASIEPAENWQREVLHTDLALDVSALSGRAVVRLATDEAQGASFEVGDLDIRAVSDAGGAPLRFRAANGRLDVGMAQGAADIVIEYAFSAHGNFEGWMPDSGTTFLWPDRCGNLYPCRSDPARGQTYSMAVSGVPQDMTAVFATEIPLRALSYMPAVAVGDYTRLELGRTANGTQVIAWHLPGEAEAAASGTVLLLAAMDFYESTYGPYPFGDAAGSVSVRWPDGFFGGMEHHPFWHVASSSFADPEVHAHEAAHGWYGNGVRIACWEDFALSEGTASYMAARALGASGIDVWPAYECRLKRVCQDSVRNTVARPAGCGSIDIASHPLWSDAPYMKGAYFLRKVAERVDADALDAALADFYAGHRGNAAGVDALVAALKAAFPDQSQVIAQLADGWFHQLECPELPQRDCP
jgi:hypothetical protein